MLEKIFNYTYKDQAEEIFKSYNLNNKKIIDTLKNRANLTSPAPGEIIGSINKVLDMKLTAKDQQRLIEKILVFVRGRKSIEEHEFFMWKQEHKMSFEIDHSEYIREWKEGVGKKTITIEEKNILFRNFYKVDYSKKQKRLYKLDEFIETLENERNDIIDSKRLLSEYLGILNRIG